MLCRGLGPPHGSVPGTLPPSLPYLPVAGAVRVPSLQLLVLLPAQHVSGLSRAPLSHLKERVITPLVNSLRPRALGHVCTHRPGRRSPGYRCQGHVFCRANHGHLLPCLGRPSSLTFTVRKLGLTEVSVPSLHAV